MRYNGCSMLGLGLIGVECYNIKMGTTRRVMTPHCIDTLIMPSEKLCTIRITNEDDPSARQNQGRTSVQMHIICTTVTHNSMMTFQHQHQHQHHHHHQSVERVDQPTSIDVMCGTGLEGKQNPGNKLFMHVVSNFLERRLFPCNIKTGEDDNHQDDS